MKKAVKKLLSSLPEESRRLLWKQGPRTVVRLLKRASAVHQISDGAFVKAWRITLGRLSVVVKWWPRERVELAPEQVKGVSSCTVGHHAAVYGTVP